MLAVHHDRKEAEAVLSRDERRNNARKRDGNWHQAVMQALRLVSLRQRFLVIGGLFVASMFELLGLTMIIPLLAAATMEVHGGKGAITNAIRKGNPASSVCRSIRC